MSVSRGLLKLIDVGREMLDNEADPILSGIAALEDAGVGGNDEDGEGKINIEAFAAHVSLIASSRFPLVCSLVRSWCGSTS
jgi:hypothetical protein